ncbi:MAG TPA: hypothetical protein VD932_03780 [Aquabacterium sp.]|nr:hypothetical protein [Aquabacterium sp.]
MMHDEEFAARFIASFKAQARDVFDWTEAEAEELAQQYLRDVPRHELVALYHDDPEATATEAIDECKHTFDWDGEE